MDASPRRRLTIGDWVNPFSADRIGLIADEVADRTPAEVAGLLDALVAENAEIHDHECLNLNPASNVMNPRAEAMLSAGLGTRASLGHPGAKYEMGLEAIEQIEVVAAELSAQVFDADFVEIRVASGAMANLYAFMAAAHPGDTIIVPPATIGGHVTHGRNGAAGLYGLDVHEAPTDADNYTIDIDALAALADRVRPTLLSVGSSLNLFPHPVAEIRAIADEVGAIVLFDAAHLSGLIAGGAWPNPLDEGAHVMTMSTYKSLAGPPGGLLVTNDAQMARRVDAIAYPGLTANFDVSVSAALAVTLLDWQTHGAAYAQEMVSSTAALAEALAQLGVAVHAADRGATTSHAFAIDAGPAGGDPLAQRLRAAHLLTSAIGLPHDEAAGLRVGTPEAVRLGMTAEDMPRLAELIATAMTTAPESVAAAVTEFRAPFTKVHFVQDLG